MRLLHGVNMAKYEERLENMAYAQRKLETENRELTAEVVRANEGLVTLGARCAQIEMQVLSNHTPASARTRTGTSSSYGQRVGSPGTKSATGQLQPLSPVGHLNAQPGTARQNSFSALIEDRTVIIHRQEQESPGAPVMSYPSSLAVAKPSQSSVLPSEGQTMIGQASGLLEGTSSAPLQQSAIPTSSRLLSPGQVQTSMLKPGRLSSAELQSGPVPSQPVSTLFQDPQYSDGQLKYISGSFSAASPYAPQGGSSILPQPAKTFPSSRSPTPATVLTRQAGSISQPALPTGGTFSQPSRPATIASPPPVTRPSTPAISRQFSGQRYVSQGLSGMSNSSSTPSIQVGTVIRTLR